MIAVDAEFTLLERCWCLAEIARAASMGMKQNSLILSPEAMDRHYRLLSAIDVRACRASCPQDRDFILSKIPDTDAFNARLQWLMLSNEGIFMQQHRCPYDRMVSASRIAARIYSAHVTLQPSCGTCGTESSGMTGTTRMSARRSVPSAKPEPV